MDLQQSGSWNHERDDGEDEQVLQPKIKRKRSIRSRPRPNAEKQEDRSGVDGAFHQRGARLLFSGDGDYDSQLKSEQDAHALVGPTSRQQDAVHLLVKQKRNMPSRKAPPASRAGKSSHLSGSAKVTDSKMSDSMQRKVSMNLHFFVCLRWFTLLKLLSTFSLKGSWTKRLMSLGNTHI
jgi:SWI/SNF-related matrix-associated actin-dependent regulator of chromatin subfamily A protein 2/4